MATVINIGINGFGRIGRNIYRNIMDRNKVGRYPPINIVWVNDVEPAKRLAYLLKHDSVQGNLAESVSADRHDNIIVEGASFHKKFPVLSERDPSHIPAKELGTDIVFEATGKFRDMATAAAHLTAGAKKVIITAPASDEDIPFIVMGVNEDVIKPEHEIISNSSCTTNCLAPVVKVLDEEFGVERGFMSTIHAYTADQRLVDSPHKDLRRARAAGVNITPTKTGAAAAIGRIMPHLVGRIDGKAYRVPVADGSVIDLSVELKTEVSVAMINTAMQTAANGPLRGILAYSKDELVSSDIIGNPHSSIFDSLLTKVLQSSPQTASVVSWYDNEMGYSARSVDLALYWAMK